MNGIIIIDKPEKFTSHDVVARLRRILNTKKIGHTGTLDPFAEGILMIGIAGAARLNEWIHSEMSKTYIAHGVLGLNTDTGDLTVEPNQVDDSDYLKTVISEFSKEFIEKQLKVLWLVHKLLQVFFKGLTFQNLIKLIDYIKKLVKLALMVIKNKMTKTKLFN